MTKQDYFYKLLGNKIRKCREKVGLTQAELAEAIGISRTAVTNIECGHQRVFVDQFELICQVIGAVPSDLFDKQIRPVKPTDTTEKIISTMPVVAKFLETVRQNKEIPK